MPNFMVAIASNLHIPNTNRPSSFNPPIPPPLSLSLILQLGIRGFLAVDANEGHVHLASVIMVGLADGNQESLDVVALPAEAAHHCSNI